MRKLVIIGVLQLLFSISANASDYIFVSATPTQVHIVPEGLLLEGDFKNTGVSCAGTLNPRSILLTKDDPMFSHKVSLALAANMSGKIIETLVYTGSSSDCIQISASGYMPKAHHYYWRLK
jgi:hypothetical protein